MITKAYSEIPNGLWLLRARFQSQGGAHLYALHLKTSDAPWYDSAKVPTHSQGIKGYEEFWAWAEQNLPIWDYPNEIKAASQ